MLTKQHDLTPSDRSRWRQGGAAISWQRQVAVAGGSRAFFVTLCLGCASLAATGDRIRWLVQKFRTLWLTRKGAAAEEVAVLWCVTT
jgi:hypothetical protein